LDERLAAGYGNIDWSNTQVFARTGLGVLYLNVQGRQPEGTVSPEDYTAFRQSARSFFRELTGMEGKRLFREVWRPEEHYGKLNPQDAPPDLLLEPRAWSDHLITGYPNDPLTREIPPERPYGTHTPDGIFLLSGPGLRSEADLGTARIVDVAPTILAAWGTPIPEVVDGRVLREAFLRAPQERRVAVEEMSEGISHGGEGDQEVLDRLRALGYME
jgi:predicted AlkP superfamily phosphohydrolase/phosphomutase